MPAGCHHWPRSPPPGELLTEIADQILMPLIQRLPDTGRRDPARPAAHFPAPAQDTIGEHEQYRAHVLASLAASPWARVVKASDFTDNAVAIIYTTGPKLSKLAGKYAPLVPALRELILRPDTPLEADVKGMIAGQLDAARDRFAAIGHGRDGDSTVSPPSGAQPGPA